ncbi:hypothetical protein CHS0354_033466 [Potamilus streckersoni]|uniref:Selenoprotein F/M domain-containing protein n=1 Tax=Potamilus streckersoni TaxID=2493646 RepID=A0AAE0SGV5_9BIVA|nr:hypothetical protein CHS0354_033466 [Potamilus streckersoni]
MADVSDLFTVILFYFMWAGRFVFGKLGPEHCRELGFSSNLLCSSCNDLDQFRLSTLKEDCLKCCEEDTSTGDALKVYPYAELQVCG